MATARVSEKGKKIIFFFALLLIIFAFDRFTKCSAVASEHYSINPGAAFGLFSGFSLIMPLLIIISCIVLILTAFFYFKTKKFSLLHIGFSLLFSGTLCNIYGRLFFRYVIDFITFSFLPQFPAFNIADVANVAGVILLIFFLVKKSKQGE